MQPQAQGKADAQSFRLDSLRIENGTIVYRDRGQVVEQGSHAELLARDGLHHARHLQAVAGGEVEQRPVGRDDASA